MVQTMIDALTPKIPATGSFMARRAPSVVRHFLEACARPVVLGSDDCCTAVADVLRFGWGVDLMVGWRGAYDSETSLARRLVEAGHQGIAQLIERQVELAGGRALGEGAPVREWDLGLLLSPSVSSEPDGSKRREHTELVPAFFFDGWWRARLHEGGCMMSPAGTEIAHFRHKQKAKSRGAPSARPGGKQETTTGEARSGSKQWA